MACIKKNMKNLQAKMAKKTSKTMHSYPLQLNNKLFCLTHVQAYPLSIPMVKAEISLLLKSFKNSQ
jgi:hypothetical protein